MIPSGIQAGIGYVRVSTHHQDSALQTDALAQAGVERVFEDIGVSGATTVRPGLRDAMDYLREATDSRLDHCRLRQSGDMKDSHLLVARTMLDRNFTAWLRNLGRQRRIPASDLPFCSGAWSG